MSRVTAPVSKLSRSINSAAGRLENPHNAGAVLTPKYAELLKNRRTNEPESHSRGLKTTHRPSSQPKPSPAYTRPLMQTFSSSPRSSARADTSTIDYALLPFSLGPSEPLGQDEIPSRMPLLPDSFAVRHTVADAADAPLAKPEISVIAAVPGQVAAASALTEVEGMGMDGVELGFVHDQSEEGEGQRGMLKDLWKGLVDDVLGDAGKRKTAA